MKISKAKRSRGGAATPDLSPLAQLLYDRRIWTEVGVVARGEGESQHYKLEMEGDTVTDILVNVETVPRGLDLLCRLGASAGGAGAGLWRIPAEGDEVLVLVPAGEIGFMPSIVAVLSSRRVPERAGPGKTVLVATDAIEIVAPSVTLGNPEAVQKLMTETAMATYNSHTHPDPSSGSTGPPTQQMSASHLTSATRAE